jgi:hypothetical protein
MIAAYVRESGGALAVVAGKRFTPAAYRESELAPLLPVTVAPQGLDGGRGDASTAPVKLVLTASGAANPMLDLGGGTGGASDGWADLPPVYWTARVSGSKPGADVLVAGGAEGSSLTNSLAPVVAIQRVGAGEVLFVGTDNTWRWRRNTGDGRHARFWGQIVQRMAGHRLVGGARHTRVTTATGAYRPGDRVAVLAELRDAAWRPLGSSTVAAVLEPRDGTGAPRSEFDLIAVPGAPGHYRATLAAPGAGDFRIDVPGTGAAPAHFSVREPGLELRDIAMAEADLRRAAAATGGAFFREESLHHLPAAVTRRHTATSVLRELDLWSAPVTLVALFALLTAEWVVRKLAGLK